MLNMKLIGNPYNWVIVILMLTLGALGFHVVTSKLGLTG